MPINCYKFDEQNDKFKPNNFWANVRRHESKCLCMDGIHIHGHDEQVDDVVDFECGSVKSVGEVELNAVLCVDAIHFMYNAAEK